MTAPPAEDRRARLGLSKENRRAGRVHLVFSLFYGAVAIAGFALGSTEHGFHEGELEKNVITGACLAAFLIFGMLGTKRIAKATAALMTVRAARAAGAAVRLLVTAVGYLVVLFGSLGLIGVNAGRLLVGGTVAGVVLGIAAQQSLSNVFAGFVLSVARPFAVGDHIRVRAGALNGPFDGVVLGMSLTYVTLFVEGGVLKVPNSAMLAAGVGQYPAKDRSVVDAARAAGAPFTPPQGIAAVPGPPSPQAPASGQPPRPSGTPPAAPADEAPLPAGPEPGAATH